MSILELVCGIIIILIIISIVIFFVRFLFPGPDKSYVPPPYHHQPYSEREYPPRQYPQSPYTQRQYPPPSQPSQPPAQTPQTQQKAQIAYCNGCGKQIPTDANICPYCGREITR